MRKSILYLAFCCIFFIQGLVSCNEEDPEPIIITAEYPSTVKLKSTFSDQDTLKFKIVSDDEIKYIRFYENDKMLINRGINVRGEFNLNLLYNPNSTGVKNLKLIVETLTLEEDYLFSIRVEE